MNDEFQEIDDLTVEEARDRLRELVYPELEDGSHGIGEAQDCPVCGQTVKVYPRTLHAGMAVLLIRAFRRHVTDHFELAELAENGHESLGDFAKLRYWHLIERMPGRREDGSPRTGWWRVTPDGRDFVLRRRLVQKRVVVFNGKALRFAGERILIDEALGDRFDYGELMFGGAGA